MSTEEKIEIVEAVKADGRVRDYMNWVGTFGVPAVLLMLWYFQIYKPDQDQRRELERDNVRAMGNISQTVQMLVEQDRRREETSRELLKSQQEALMILKQIMLDQRRGAWREPVKPDAEMLTTPNT